MAAAIFAGAAASDSWQTITVKTLAVSFQLPTSWSQVTLKPEFQTNPPDHSAFLRILDQQTSMSIDAIGKSFAQAELSDLRKGDPKASVVVGNVALKGGPAVKVTMRYRGNWVGRKTQITRLIYFMKKGSRAYDFDFGAAEAYAKERAVFGRIINSVRLKGA